MHLSPISTQIIEKSEIKKTVITYNFMYALVDFESIIAIEIFKKIRSGKCFFFVVLRH